MIRAVSVPYEPTSVDTPNISPTLWRVYADTKDMVYYYESAIDPTAFWVDMTKMDLSSKGKVMKLDLMNVSWKSRVGDMTSQFKASEPFKPLEIDGSGSEFASRSSKRT